jgi:acetyl esterase/lipase
VTRRVAASAAILAVALSALLWRRNRITTLLWPVWIRTTADIAYGPAPDQRLDIYRRRLTRDARPGAVVFHGGAWRNGSRADALDLAQWFLERGFVVANVEYRRGAVVAAAEDAQQALEWVYDHGAAFQIDTERMIVTGQSAGAHLALWCGLQSRRRPRAIVNFFGIADLTSMLESPKVRSALPERDVEAAARYASPVAHIGAPVPAVLSIHGSADEVVPPAQARLLTESIQRAGGHAEEVIIDGAGHGFSPNRPEARAALLRFLKGEGLLR